MPIVEIARMRDPEKPIDPDWVWCAWSKLHPFPNVLSVRQYQLLQQSCRRWTFRVNHRAGHLV